ncbi:MAG: tetratricopeptide repeat protein [Acidobacteriota bacterium]
MKYSVDSNQIISNLSTLVEMVRLSEQSLNYQDTISAFRDFWSDIDREPDFSEFTLSQQGELFRLSGYFLSRYGKHKNLVNYQERGKNHLTKAVEIFTSSGQIEKIAEAQNALSICYYYEGAILEAEAILEQTANDFLKNKLDLLYLQNRGNLLMTKLFRGKFEEALSIIEEIIVPMEFCEDKKACSTFHDTAGRTFKGLKQYNRAITHYQRAIKYAEEINNFSIISNIKNNLANLYRMKGDFAFAHLWEDDAIQMAYQYNLIGWLPHYLDTKASICFDEGNFNLALETINEAISIFQKGEDAGGLTEALWNKCKFLLYLNRKVEAIKLFGELAPITSERVGGFAIDNFSNEFAELIHVKRNGSLDEETKRFRRVEVITAIRKAKYEMVTAAKSLKIEFTALQQIIDKEFPELYEEINIERFANPNIDKNEILPVIQRNITQLFLPNSTTNLSDNFTTFYFAQEINEKLLGISHDIVMAIQPITEISVGDFILIYNKLNGVFSFGKTQYDSILNLYFLADQTEPIVFSPDEVNIVGKAISYLPFSEIDKQHLNFISFDF